MADHQVFQRAIAFDHAGFTVHLININSDGKLFDPGPSKYGVRPRYTIQMFNHGSSRILLQQMIFYVEF